MNARAFAGAATKAPDSGLRALCAIAAYYRIAADPAHLGREFALTGRAADEADLVRAARAIGLKARARAAKAPARSAPRPGDRLDCKAARRDAWIKPRRRGDASPPAATASVPIGPARRIP
jgi:hypothetical protein